MPTALQSIAVNNANVMTCKWTDIDKCSHSPMLPGMALQNIYAYWPHT